MPQRPSLIRATAEVPEHTHVYPGSDEPMGPVRRLGKAAGLERIGVVLLLVGGEAPKAGSRIFYPLHPSRRHDMPEQSWWADVPKRPLGEHDGLPDARRPPAA